MLFAFNSLINFFLQRLIKIFFQYHLFTMAFYEYLIDSRLFSSTFILFSSSFLFFCIILFHFIFLPYVLYSFLTFSIGSHQIFIHPIFSYSFFLFPVGSRFTFFRMHIVFSTVFVFW